MKNSAMRVATKQQLELLVSKLDAYAKRKPLREAEVGGAPAPVAATPAAAPAPVANNPQVPASPAPSGSEQDADPSNQEQEGVATLDNVIEQLNTLRAGRSLKDQNVRGELERYYQGLDNSEKEAMHAYLKGIAQILSGQIDAAIAEEPKNHGVDTQNNGKRTKTIKPNIVRNQSVAPVKNANTAPTVSKSSVENTAAPAPIVPKKR
jgi:hypothetical protein